jgi:hypothetical protein
MKAEDLTIKKVEQAIGLKADRWAGKCYELAWCIAKRYKMLDGTPVYGHWIGAVHPDSYWALRAGTGFIQHGWVLLPDDRILDPTRWAFENKEPYLWLGKNDGSYDEGGNRLRKRFYTDRPCPRPKADTMDEEDDTRQLCLTLSMDAQLHLWLYSGRVLSEPWGSRGYWVEFEQLFWVANAPFMDLEPHAREIYQAIINVKQAALIPIDNRHMAFREEASP